MKTLEQYLRENFTQGIIDHEIRTDVDFKGHVTFYIHPAGVSGDTLDFYVHSNELFDKKYLEQIKFGNSCPSRKISRKFK